MLQTHLLILLDEIQPCHYTNKTSHWLKIYEGAWIQIKLYKDKSQFKSQKMVENKEMEDKRYI